MHLIERFEESPFAPLGEHMAKVKECVALVLPMFETLRRGDHDRLEGLVEKVFKLEHEADQLKDEIRLRIPKSFLLPVYRGDLLAYLKIQDDMADAVEDLGVQLTIKKLPVPSSIADDILGYVKLVVQVAEQLFEATDQLPALVHADFGGPRTSAIVDLVSRAEKKEWETDKAEYALARKLFALEDTMKPTDIFLWSHVLMTLGKLANYAQKTGDRLRRMLH